MSENKKRSRPDKEPEEPNYEVSGATVKACLESNEVDLPDNIYYIADHNLNESYNEDSD